ncbi:MAG: hypothetical protein ACRDF5_01400 [bacterium]
MTIALAGAVLISPPRLGAGEMIRGRVINGTLNNSPVAGQTVQLLRMSEDSATPLASTKTDHRGRFVFNVPGTESVSLVVARYRGIQYASKTLQPTSNTGASEDISVYEPTTDRPEISYSYRIVLIDRLGIGVISVREVVGVVNPSLRTYIGREDVPGRRVALSVDLPRGAEGVTVLAGIPAPIVEPGRLLDASPLVPGVRDVAFKYQVRYWGSKAALRWSLAESTGSMDVFAPDLGERLRSATLETKPSGAVRGQRFLRLAQDNLAEGDEIEVELTGLPGNYAPVARWLAGLLALMLAAVLVVSVRGSKARGNQLPGDRLTIRTISKI